jgi:hypothetical protein
MKIEVGKRYKSGDEEGVVLSVTRNDPQYPTVFLRDDGKVDYFTINGECWEEGGDEDLNLQEIPKSYWVNVYDTEACLHPTKKEADFRASSHRIACIKVKEGEFHED